MSGAADGCPGEDIATVPDHRHDGDFIMQTIPALPGNARTYLVHSFGRGLDGEDCFVVERFKTMLDGDIRPIQPEAPGRVVRGRGKRAPGKHPAG